MGIASEMKTLSENIIASYDMRVKAIGDLVKDTHKMLEGCTADRKDMAAVQAKALAGFVAELTEDVSSMIKSFQKEQEAMADELKKDLGKSKAARLGGEADRLNDFKSVMAGIQKDVKSIEVYTKKKLKEFSDAHADMSEELRNMLVKHVDDMVKASRKLMSDSRKLMSGIKARRKNRNAEVADLLEASRDLMKAYRDDSKKMAANWEALTVAMARRKTGKPVVSAGTEVTAVAKAAKAKPKAKKAVAKKKTPAAKKTTARKSGKKRKK